jgi:hypothetical protein
MSGMSGVSLTVTPSHEGLTPSGDPVFTDGLIAYAHAPSGVGHRFHWKC